MNPDTTRNVPASHMQGFTLVELLIAVAITSMLIVAVLEVFQASLYAREEVNALSQTMTGGPRILDMIEDDIHSTWTLNIKDNRVFRGENRDFVGDNADRIHLIVSGRTINTVRLPDDSERVAPVAEVSYLVKANVEDSQHLELWRREDPLIDNELTEGGYFQLLSNRVRSFNVTYFEELGIDAEPLDDWDVAEKNRLPRRIKIELEIERGKDTFNKLREVEDVGKRVDKFVRHVVLDPGTVETMEPGIALIPLVPDGPPEAENALAGGGAAGGRKAGLGGEKAGAGSTRTTRGAGRGKPGSNPLGGRGGKTGTNFDQILRDLQRGGGAGRINFGGGGGNNSSGGRRR